MSGYRSHVLASDTCLDHMTQVVGTLIWLLCAVLDLEGVQEPFGSHFLIKSPFKFTFLGRSPKLPQLDLTLTMCVYTITVEFE